MVDFAKASRVNYLKSRKATGYATPEEIQELGEHEAGIGRGAEVPEERLDHTPISFGKYCHYKTGKPSLTPSEIAEIDPHWLVWAFDTIKDKKVCSQLLRDECAKQPKPDRGYSYTPKKIAQPYPHQQRTSSPRLKDHFDDYDDDEIPF